MADDRRVGQVVDGLDEESPERRHGERHDAPVELVEMGQAYYPGDHMCPFYLCEGMTR